MKSAAAIVPILLLASAARAGELYGTVSEGAKPVPAGMTLRLVCGDASAEAKTDAFGAYSVKVGATGKCALTAASVPGSPSLTVTVYDKSARYDLALVRSGAKYTILRK